MLRLFTAADAMRAVLSAVCILVSESATFIVGNRVVVRAKIPGKTLLLNVRLQLLASLHACDIWMERSLRVNVIEAASAAVAGFLSGGGAVNGAAESAVAPSWCALLR
jgi:hypothetical protein